MKHERTENGQTEQQTDELLRNYGRAVMNMAVLEWCLNGGEVDTTLEPTIDKNEIRRLLEEKEAQERKDYLDYMTA